MWKRAVCIDGCYKVTNNTPDPQLLWQSLNAKMNSNYKMYSNYETMLQCKATISMAQACTFLCREATRAAGTAPSDQTERPSRTPAPSLLSLGKPCFSTRSRVLEATADPGTPKKSKEMACTGSLQVCKPAWKTIAMWGFGALN